MPNMEGFRVTTSVIIPILILLSDSLSPASPLVHIATNHLKITSFADNKNLLSILSNSRSSKAYLPTVPLNRSSYTSIGTQPSLLGNSDSPYKLSKVIAISPLQVLQSVMTECQCMHVVVQDPTFVIRASHECFCLLLRADVESLVVDALEAAFDHCISLLLCLMYTLVQIDVLHAHPLSIDHHIARNSLCCVVYHMLLINLAVHLRSQSYEFSDAMSVVFVLEDGSRQLLVEVDKRFQ